MTIKMTKAIIYRTLLSFFIAFAIINTSSATDQELNPDSLYKQASKYYLVNNDSAIIFFNRAYSQYKSHDNKKLEMVCLSKLAAIYNDKGDIDTAMILSYNAISIGLENNLDTVLAETYLRHGNLYLSLGDFHEAKAFYYKVIKLGFPNTTNGAWAALGILYSKANKYDSAYIFLNKSYLYFLSLDTNLHTVMYNISSITGSLGINSFDRGKAKEGLKYLKESLRISKKIGSPTNIISNLLNISIAYDMQKQYSNSEKVLKQAYEIADSINNPRLRYRVYLLQSEHYYETQNYKLAYEYLNFYYTLKDSLGMVDYKKSLHKKETKYLKEIQNIELKKLELEKETNKLEFIITFGISGFAFILLTLFLFRKIKIRNLEKRKLELRSKNLDDKLKNADNRLLDLELRLEKQHSELIKNKKLSISQNNITPKESVAELENRKIILTEDWQEYKELFNSIYPDFLSRVLYEFPNLTEGEKRQLIMLKLNYNRNKSANILGISPDSVKKARQRLTKKIKLKDASMLNEFISSY